MKVLIVHFRSAPSHGLKEPRRRTRAGEIDSAGTDGVSLEMMKRRTLLEAMGHQVAICSAYNWANFPIPALEFDAEEVMHIMQNLFGPGLVDFASEAELDFPKWVDTQYREWFNELKSESYGDNGYPWTRLGYTYDWGNPKDEIGLSEFIIPGSTVKIQSVTGTLDYSRN